MFQISCLVMYFGFGKVLINHIGGMLRKLVNYITEA